MIAFECYAKLMKESPSGPCSIWVVWRMDAHKNLLHKDLPLYGVSQVVRHIEVTLKEPDGAVPIVGTESEQEAFRIRKGLMLL